MRRNRQSNQITEDEFERLDTVAYRLERGFLELVESLEEKREAGESTDHLMIEESNLVVASE